MIDQNLLKNPPPIPDFRKGVTIQKRNAKISKRTKVTPTEIKLITHNIDFELLEKEWNELAWKSDTHIFQTFEWNRIWWKHFGTEKKLRIIAVYAENKLVGIAPFFEDDVTLFGRKVYSGLRLLGSYVSQPAGEPLMGSISYSDYLDCIIYPGYEKIFYKQILEYFREITSEFDEIILDEVSEESSMCNKMIPLMVENDSWVNFKIEQASISPVILLDSTWKEYLTSMNVKDRYNARRYFKRSKQGNSKAFKIEKIKHADELTGVLKEMIRMHQKQWNSRGFAGTFAEKRMSNFFIEIAHTFYEKGWIEFNKAIPAESNDIIVAVDVFLTYKNRVYLMHRGMDEDSLYRKQGPGNVLLYTRLNEAIHEGVKVFDMLRGSEEFKLRMATKINQNKKLVVLSGSNSQNLKPGIVKKYLKIKRHIKVERHQVELVTRNKPFLRGVSEYIRFLHRRIKHKLNS